MQLSAEPLGGEKRKMRVIIVGGGLGGVTLAAALTLRGIDFELMERASEFAPAGAGIALMFPALRIGEKLGIFDALEAASCDLPTMRWLYRSGAPLQEFDYSTVWQGRQGAPAAAAQVEAAAGRGTLEQHQLGVG